MRRFDAGTRLIKNETEIGTENRHFTKRQMADESCRMEPRIQLKIQDQQSDRKTKKEMEDDIKEFLKLVEEKRENLTAESSSQINKNMDQHSIRPQKMDFSRRRLHNDF